jgi:hypothetical protein
MITTNYSRRDQATLSMVSPKSQASSRSSDPVRRAMPGSQPCAAAGLTVA